MTPKKDGRGRPPTGQGERMYFPIPKVKSAKLLKDIPDEQMPVIEAVLQAFWDQASQKKSQNS